MSNFKLAHVVLECKYHVVLVSRPGNILTISGKTGILMAGEVYATRKAEACA